MRARRREPAPTLVTTMTQEIIESVETRIVDIPIKRVHNFSATRISTKSSLLVRIRTRQGLMGIGEATTPGGPWWAGEAVESIKTIIDTYFTPSLIEENALNVSRLMHKLDTIAVNNNFAKAAVEMSLLDLKGRALGVPMYEFFGGLHRESATILWPLAMGEAKADIEEAERKMADNVAQDFKVKMGYKSAEEDVRYLGELCKGLCDRATVRGDLNAAWDEVLAKKYLPMLQDRGMYLMEQPVQTWNRPAMARLCRSLTMPILADESVQSLQDARETAQLMAADAVSLKPLKTGGLLATQRLAAITEVAGIRSYAGTFLETSIGTASFMHLVAASPSIDFGNELVGPIWLADDIVQEPVVYSDNQIWVKHGPGLGVELDEDKVKHYLRK